MEKYKSEDTGMDKLSFQSLNAPTSAITSVRGANQWLKNQGRSDLKVISRQDDHFGRVYSLFQFFNNGRETLLMQGTTLDDVIEHVVTYHGVKPCQAGQKVVEKKDHVIKDVESFNAWLQAPEIRQKSLGLGTHAGEWEIEVKEHKPFGKLYCLRNKRTGRYWIGNNFMKCASLNILEWIETVCITVNSVKGIEKPKYIGEILKADTVANANKLLYLKGLNKGEDWHKELAIKQQGNKFVAVIKFNGQEKVVFTGDTPGQCLQHFMLRMGFGYPGWIYK